MPNLIASIPTILASTCSIMRISREVITRGKKKAQIINVKASFGTGWCIVADKYVITAHHILNDMKPRNPNDRFYAFIVPGNAPLAFHFQVVGFPLEDQANDIAILEIGACSASGQHLQALPVTFQRPPDGTVVATYGFPSPQVFGINVNPDTLAYNGGQFQLKGNANEGIVSAQYDMNGVWVYEFNVGWHHGESGGPILLLEPLAVFSIMQLYRKIQAPHGVMDGPRIGRSIEVIRNSLQQLGAMII